MISIRSYIESAIRTLRIGLSLYLESVTSALCTMVTALAPQFGSSLYDPDWSDCTWQPEPITKAAG